MSALLGTVADGYLSRGWRIVPLKDKKPTDPTTGKPLSGWQKSDFKDTSLFNGNTTGVGVICDKIADIDLDSPVARYLAPRIMPTTAKFGRAGRTTHLVYDCTEEYFEDIQLPGKDSHIELRATGGHQTMFPGSLHPNGDQVEWMNDLGPTKIALDDLRREANLVAVACIFCHFYEEGNRDNLITILSRILHEHLSLAVETIQIVTDAVMDFADDTDLGRRHKASKTVRQLANGKIKPGLPRLKEIIGKEWTDRVSELLHITAPILWTEPEHVFHLHDVPDCPLYLFPDVIADPVRQISAALEVPLESVLFPALITTAWSGGARCQIKLKRNQNFIQPSILFAFVAARSGMGKSPAANMITRNVVDFQSKMKAMYDVQLAEWNELPRNEQRTTRKPTFTQFLITNYTIEGLIKANEVNPRGVMIIMDELSPMFFQGGKYSSGVSTDEPQLCSMYDGGAISKLRAGDDASIYCSQTNGSIFGNIQPDILHMMVTDENISLGLIARFGLSAMPKPVQQHGVDLAIDQTVIDKFFARIDALKFCFDGDPTHKITFTLDDEAQQLFNQKHTEIIRTRDANDDPLHTHLAKYPGLLGRLILVMWLLSAEIQQSQKTDDGKERHFQQFSALVIPKQIVEAAITFLDYLHRHAAVWYEKAEQKPGAKEGQRIARWIVANRPEEITVRELYRERKLKLDKKTSCLGLQWLDSMNWGNFEPDWRPARGTGGRGSPRFFVNPLVANVTDSSLEAGQNKSLIEKGEQGK